MRVGELDAEMVSLIPDQILMKEKTELTMYFITQWAIVQTEPSNPDIGISMIVVMKRRIMNEMLTTYLPSILLMLITYSTTFFKPYFFEAALTVNLTTMLVLTTIFISVMEKLPSTAYIKLIDVWLIFCQLIPFTEVVLLTVIEFRRDDNGKKINHHGQERVVNLNNYQEKGTIMKVSFFPEKNQSKRTSL